MADQPVHAEQRIQTDQPNEFDLRKSLLAMVRDVLWPAQEEPEE